MGTNYYLEGYESRKLSSDPVAQKLHIGKSSGGWVFALHVIPELSIIDLSDWKVLFADPKMRIVDEYNGELTPDEMLQIITCRERKVSQGNSPRSAEWLRDNYAMEGPRGLVRAVVSPDSHCAGHGEGTWDLIEGEFS